MDCGFNPKNSRGSLAKTRLKGYRSISAVGLEAEGLDPFRGGRRDERRPEQGTITAAPWPGAPHLAGVHLFLDLVHQSLSRAHGELEKRTANSPRGKSLAESKRRGVSTPGGGDNHR